MHSGPSRWLGQNVKFGRGTKGGKRDRIHGGKISQTLKSSDCNDHFNFNFIQFSVPDSKDSAPQGSKTLRKRNWNRLIVKPTVQQISSIWRPEKVRHKPTEWQFMTMKDLGCTSYWNWVMHVIKWWKQGCAFLLNILQNASKCNALYDVDWSLPSKSFDSQILASLRQYRSKTIALAEWPFRKLS